MKLSLLIHKAKAKLEDYLSLPKLVNLLAGLIVLLSCTQLGLHFWPSSALVYGVRVDYLSPTLYFLDLLIVIFLAFNFKLKAKSYQLKALLPLLLANLLFSVNPVSSLNWSLHFLLYLSFIFSLSLSQLKTLILKLLPLAMLFQVILAGAQTWLGHTLQGPFYWLGERALNVGSPTVAKAAWLGHMTLRSYGTFSHPNILAGWLVIACLITLILSRNIKYKILNIALSSFGLLLTQSRSAALAFFGLVIPFSLIHSLRFRVLYFALLITTTVLILTGRPISFSDLSVTERLSLQQVSLAVIRTYPLFGVGSNAGISTYPTISPSLRLLQPDHDSFTLLLSWFGLVGVLVIAFLLKAKCYQLKALLPLLPLLLLDHYLLTSPQGLFILILYFRLTAFPDKQTPD